MHHLLELATLPDDLYDPTVPTDKWMDHVTRAKAFPPGSLGKQLPVAPKAEAERLVGIPLYLMLNWLPFMLPLVSFAMGGWRGIVIFVVVLVVLSFRRVTTFLYKWLSLVPKALGVPPEQLSGQYA